MAEPKQILFLMGVGRSGTTAMTDLLNAHPAICLGLERFKLRFLRAGAFTGTEFARERFFTFEDGDTNIIPARSDKWRALYHDMAPKYDGASIVGDKIPHLFEKFDACAAAFPCAKWIYMLRGIEGVASSWNARALNEDDAWPGTSDYRVAIETWNEANATIRSRLNTRLGRRVHVVCYEDFFSGNPVAYAALLAFLELDAPAAFEAYVADCFRQYEETVLSKPPLRLEGQAAHIRQHADLATYRDLVRASGRA